MFGHSPNFAVGVFWLFPRYWNCQRQLDSTTFFLSEDVSRAITPATHCGSLDLGHLPSWCQCHWSRRDPRRDSDGCQLMHGSLKGRLWTTWQRCIPQQWTNYHWLMVCSMLEESKALRGSEMFAGTPFDGRSLAATWTDWPEDCETSNFLPWPPQVPVEWNREPPPWLFTLAYCQIRRFICSHLFSGPLTWHLSQEKTVARCPILSKSEIPKQPRAGVAVTVAVAWRMCRCAWRISAAGTQLAGYPIAHRTEACHEVSPVNRTVASRWRAFQANTLCHGLGQEWAHLGCSPMVAGDALILVRLCAKTCQQHSAGRIGAWEKVSLSRSAWCSVPLILRRGRRWSGPHLSLPGTAWALHRSSWCQTCSSGVRGQWPGCWCMGSKMTHKWGMILMMIIVWVRLQATVNQRVTTKRF